MYDKSVSKRGKRQEVIFHLFKQAICGEKLHEKDFSDFACTSLLKTYIVC